LENFLKKSGDNTTLAKKWQNRKSKRTRPKTKRGDRKVDSNDSPEIPDNGVYYRSMASLLGKKT